MSAVAVIVRRTTGNCETMITRHRRAPHRAQRLNPVPVAVVVRPEQARLAQNRSVGRSGPHVLQLMG